MNEPQCLGCGLDLLSYLSVREGRDIRCLRCGRMQWAPRTRKKEEKMATKAKEVKKPCIWQFASDYVSSGRLYCMVHKHTKKAGPKEVKALRQQRRAKPGNTVLAYVKEHEGKRVRWGQFTKAVGLSSKQLIEVLTALMDEGVVTEPGGPGSLVYHVARPKASLQRAA